MLVGCGQAGDSRRHCKLISFYKKDFNRCNLDAGFYHKMTKSGRHFFAELLHSRIHSSPKQSTTIIIFPPPSLELNPSLLYCVRIIEWAGGREGPCILRPPARPRPRAAPVTPACHAVPLPFPCPVPRPVSLCHSIYPFLYSQAPRANAPSYPNEKGNMNRREPRIARLGFPTWYLGDTISYGYKLHLCTKPSSLSKLLMLECN